MGRAAVRKPSVLGRALLERAPQERAWSLDSVLGALGGQAVRGDLSGLATGQQHHLPMVLREGGEGPPIMSSRCFGHELAFLVNNARGTQQASEYLREAIPKSRAHRHVNEGIHARVDESEKVDEEHCEEEIMDFYEALLLELGNDRHDEVRRPGDREGSHHEKYHLRYLMGTEKETSFEIWLAH